MSFTLLSLRADHWSMWACRGSDPDLGSGTSTRRLFHEGYRKRVRNGCCHLRLHERHVKAAYAAALNLQISTINTSMHNGTLEWLHTVDTVLTHTFDNYTNIQSAITTVFGGTALNDPVQNFLQCLLGSKVWCRSLSHR
ncbi:hypothetical protein R3P38DRAFT_3235146 [Favolaschia claudopus]|uniref:Uncharacterized protein n=1 Tax=Favolaschia claudopus TaxID=2862362 RepID=A0AAV9ZFE6_9AGAR